MWKPFLAFKGSLIARVDMVVLFSLSSLLRTVSWGIEKWCNKNVIKIFYKENVPIKKFSGPAFQLLFSSFFGTLTFLEIFTHCVSEGWFSLLSSHSHTYYMQTMYLWIFFSRWVEYRVRVIKILDKRSFNIILKNGWR